MVRLSVRVVDMPTSFDGYGAIQLVHQSKKGCVPGNDGVFVIELNRKADRSGVEQWVGESVYFYGDKRRFLYFAWISQTGQSFRRIKLFLDSIPGLSPEVQAMETVISGRGKDGSPACATVKVIQ